MTPELGAGATLPGMTNAGTTADLLIVNGLVTTLDKTRPEAEALAISAGRIAAIGTTRELVQRFPDAKRIDAGPPGRAGIYDSHMHVIRGGLNYNL